MSIFYINSMQISNILLKLKGYDEKLNDISKISTNKDNITSNLSEIKNIKNDMTTTIRKNNFDKTYTISNFSKNYNKYKIFELSLDKQFTNDGILKINGKYDYNNNDKFSHTYNFYNNNNYRLKEIISNHKDNIINDVFEIKTIESSQIRVLIYLVNNNSDNSTIELYDNNTIQFIYEDNVNTSKIDININDIYTNENNIASNLKKNKYK